MGKSKSTESKREKEKRIVSLMIRLYCRKKHGGRKAGEELCEECRELEDYATLRVDKCPFMETKTFCSNCRVHCYRPEMREQIRQVMRFAGPWMILYYPVMALRHVISSAAEKKQLEREAASREDKLQERNKGK